MRNAWPGANPARMGTAAAAGRLAVPRQVDDRKCFAHCPTLNTYTTLSSESGRKPALPGGAPNKHPREHRFQPGTRAVAN